MSVKLTKLNRVIREVDEDVFRNGDATVCRTTAYVYLPWYAVNYTNEREITEILTGVDIKHSDYPVESDMVGKNIFKVFEVNQTSYVLKHDDDVDDQHLADILAKQKAMQKIEERVMKVLHLLCVDLDQKMAEMDGLLDTYQDRHIKNLKAHVEHLEKVESK